ncbi:MULTISPECIES: MDR family MFS transporter [Bacillus]|uniref:MDR family MFS transporter n=1 Tax=Bacillus TaxID=1386 RepID=UPI000760CD32|nr:MULTISPECIES: MFS transporter [Bacillus]AOC56258.1 transporter [Bacillus pumilus]AZV52860.1 MFS transporter [Bacillus pumilus]MBR0585615.1 MFS transporter [Bacillus pumilus DW2J2]MBR0615832.1 MFS transporter [Bacillus pumilus]MBR0619604.1 MFS transporter [Bacillus pumilus]
MKNNLRTLHPLSWTIIIGTIFGRMATSMSIPFLAVYLTQVKGASASSAGLIIAVSSLIGIVASFYGGYISDRIGRKKVMLLSIFGWSLVFVGFAFADAIWVFFIMNALNGLCRALFEPTSKALLSDVTPSSIRLFVFNLRYTAINIGVIFGPLLGLYLGSSKTTFPFLVAAFIYLLYGLTLVWQFQKHPVAAPESTKQIGVKKALSIIQKDTVFSIILIGVTLCSFGYSHLSSTLPQYLSASPMIEDGPKLFGYLLSLNAVVVIVVQYPLIMIAKRYSTILSLTTGNILLAGSLFAIAFSQSLGMLAFIIVVFTIGEVLLFAMMDLFVDNVAKPEVKGSYFGAMGFSQLGSVIGPFIGGLCIDYFGAAHPFSIFSVLSMVTIAGVPFLLIGYYRLKKRSAAAVAVKVSGDH